LCGLLDRPGEREPVGGPLALLECLQLLELSVEDIDTRIALGAQALVLGAGLGGAGDEERVDDGVAAAAHGALDLLGKRPIRIQAFAPCFP